MRLAIISDTHSFHRELWVSPSDVLIHCGDATMLGEMSITEDMADWFSYLKGAGYCKHILFVPGNHDFNFDISAGRFNSHGRQCLEAAGVEVLIDRAITLYPENTDQGIKFYGAPWVNHLPRWAFDDHGQDRFVEAPTDIDVLITHGPAFGTLDRLMNGQHVGSEHLLRYVRRCPKLTLHAHGHIHEDRGMRMRDDVEPTVYTSVNASVCNRMYEPTGRPIYVEI